MFSGVVISSNRRNGARVQDLLSAAGNVALLIGFALTLGTHPATYGATVDMLARKTRWLPRVLWMSIGLIVGATTLFTLFQFVNPDAFVHRLVGDLDRFALNHTVEIVVGVGCLLAASGVGIWRLAQPKLSVKTPQEPKSQSLFAGYFVIGFSAAIVGFTTLPVMYLVGRIVTGLSPHLGIRAAGYGVFLFFLVAPFFVIALLWTRFPALTQRVYPIYMRALAWDYRWWVAGLLAVCGVGLLGYALFIHR